MTIEQTNQKELGAIFRYSGIKLTLKTLSDSHFLALAI
jgi:hypothetical protein